MIRKLLGVLALASMAGAPELLAQVGTTTLLPAGNLTLPVGAYSALEDSKARIYGIYAGTNGEVKYKPQDTWSQTGNGQFIAADFNKSEAYLSAGFSGDRTTSSLDSGGIQYDQTRNLSAMMIRFGVVTPDAIAFAVELDSISEQRGIEARSGGQSFSGSASHNYSIFTAGFSLPVVEAVRIGALYSPGVSSKTNYDGIFSSTESRAGQGAVLQAGIGYNKPTYSVGLDGYSVSANKDSFDAEEMGTIVTLQVAVTQDAVVVARFLSFSTKKLMDGTNYLSPPEQGTSVTVGFNIRREKAVFGFRYSSSQSTASDFGNAVADADRFDSSKGSGYSLRVTWDL